MAITPQTEIRLLKVPFGLDNRNQLTFSSKQAQTDYFLSLAHTTADNCTYQRKDNIIRYPALVDNVINYNYVMYQNEAYSNKWFYAYITSIDYVNDNLSNIHITTDVFQTWQFDLDYKPSFIEREHVNDDTIGANTIPENLDVGEVIEESTDTYSLSNCYFGILTTYDPSTGNDFEGVQEVNGNLFGYAICLFDGVANVETFLKHTNHDGKIESILALILVPTNMFNSSNLHQINAKYDNATYNFYRVDIITQDDAKNAKEVSFNIAPTRSFSGYTPKNNKLFCYPYNYLLVTNNIGNHNIYKYENFLNSGGTVETSNILFNLQYAFSIGISGRLIPRNYKKVDYNIDESLPMAKYPTCTWASDAFTNWLTDNAVNVATQVISGVAGGVTSLATGNIAGGISLTASTIGNLIGQFYEASLLPSIEGGQNTGDVNFSANKNNFKFIHLRAKNEYLKVLDNFFSMFGYKVNLVKKPNIIGRQNWNYVKTIDANIEGDIPQDDLQTIKDIFNNGVTFWHNSNTFLDYTQSNNIV